MDPIFWIIRICSRKSSRENWPSSIFIAFSAASFSSTTCSKSFIRPTTSPMPRTRLGHALGAELLELVERLADADEAHRRAGDLPHAERRAAARVAVELGQRRRP